MQPVAPPAPPKPKGAVLLWLGGILIVVGIVAGVLLAVSGVRGLVDSVRDFERVSAGSGGTVELDETGTYNVYLERPGIDEDEDMTSFSGNGERFGIPQVLVYGPDGDQIDVSRPNSSLTYSANGRDGRRIGRFTIDEPGTYTVEAPGSGAYGNLAVGKGDPTDGLIKLGAAFLVGGALVVLGIALLIIGGVRRSRSRRVGYPGGPGGPYPGAPLAAGWAAPPTGPGGWAPPPTGAGGWVPPAAPGPQPGWGAPPPPPGPGDPTRPWGGPS